MSRSKNARSSRPPVTGAEKLYLICCSSFRRSDQAKTTITESGVFQLLLSAASPQAARQRSREVFAGLKGSALKSGTFPAGTEIFIDDIVEVNTVPPAGLILNYRAYGGDPKFAACLFPCGDEPSPAIQAFSVVDPDKAEVVLEPEYVVPGP